MTTIFTRIINREIPADIIYEDEIVLAFLDIRPVGYGHALIVPKTAHVNVFDGNEETLAHMMRVGVRIAIAIKKVTACDVINLIMNNGEAAGQEVFHAHLHVIPRILHDGAMVGPVRKEYTAGEATQIAEKIRTHLE